MTTIAQAIANRNTVRCDIPVIGDNVTEGQGATAFTDRWICQANSYIRALYPSTGAGTGGGLGFIPLLDTGEGTFAWPVSATGTYASQDLGPVRKAALMYGAASATFTAPDPTTSVQILYYDLNQSGSFTYQVNSGEPVTVSNTMTLAELLTASIPMSPGDTLTIAQASGLVTPDGIVHYAGDETTGVTFHGCGHFGWAAGTESNGWNQPEQYGLNWAQCFANGFPNVAAIGIMLGINDAATDNDDRTAAEFTSDLQGLISTVQGAAPALADIPLLFIIPYEANESFADTGGWPAYVSAIQSVAAGYADSVVVNLAAMMEPVADDPGYYYDDWNPNDEGHALVGGYVAGAFPPASPSGLLMAGEYDRPGLLRKPFLW